MPSNSDDEQSDLRDQIPNGTPEPGEEIHLNLKKFSLVLGAILLFTLIAGLIGQFGG